MRYDRKIKYLDYCENGERVRGSGFIKTEIFQGSFKMELTVKGVRCAGELAGEVIICGAGREEVLGRIKLEGGQGEFRHICHVDSEVGIIGSTGITCDELSGIRIPLGEGREINCMWNNAPGQVVKPSTERPEKPPAEQPEKPSAEQPAKQPAKMAEEPPEKNRKKEAGRQVPYQEEAVLRPAEKAPDLKETEAAMLRGTGSLSNSEEQQEAVPLLENKWLQLCAIYPHIKPFRDQREYLSIGPEDFVLFSSESYKAASNSFMLHGYYNYRHLILTREERRGEILYYVGVPGNYYDREKQVAIMFGFESFECAQEPAQSSDFGYYMMKVQL
ncbi:MAG: hypothetical protein K2K63_14205 [Acetatifactor sp.]|nr:hypothetical protein [Acetatifactor sp.]